MKPYYEHGGITIYHGDCREVLPTLDAGSFDLCLTDPPYGDDHDTDYTRFSGGVSDRRNVFNRIQHDEEPFDPAPLLNLKIRNLMLFGANRFSDRLPCGSLIVWDKRTANGNKTVMSDAEVAWWNRGRGVYIFHHAWDGFNRDSERGTKYHPTQKPVVLFSWCIEKTGATYGVIDPYAGAGPVLLACKRRGLPAVGCELSEQYCEVAAKRLEQECLFAPEPVAATPIQATMELSA